MLKKVVNWIIAIGIGVFIVNGVCFIYERPVAWIDRRTGVTEGVRRPDSLLVRGAEGYAVTVFDQNGYTNEDKPLIEEDYILIMGSSHTQGKEVSESEKFSYLLNKMIAEEDEHLYVYNVATDAHFLPTLLKRFSAGIEEFPNSRAVVLETHSTDYNVEEISKALEQVHYDENETTKMLFENAGTKTMIKGFVKEYIPLLSLYKSHINTINKKSNVEENTIDVVEYETIMDEVLQLIRLTYKGEIIILYHPEVCIEKNGEMICLKSKTFNSFNKLCKKNDIQVVDMSDSYIKHYNATSQVPYGFWNTVMGEGHLNAVGHKLIANDLYEVLKENY